MVKLLDANQSCLFLFDLSVVYIVKFVAGHKLLRFLHKIIGGSEIMHVFMFQITERVHDFTFGPSTLLRHEPFGGLVEGVLFGEECAAVSLVLTCQGDHIISLDL